MKCSWSRVTSFPFESFLEQNQLKHEKPDVSKTMEILEDNENNILRLRYKQFIIGNTSPYNIILLKNKNVVKVNKMTMNENTILIEGNIWEKKSSIFTFPIDSENLNMWELQKKSLEEKYSFHLSSVSCKLVCLSLNMREDLPEKVYVIPLLHH